MAIDFVNKSIDGLYDRLEEKRINDAVNMLPIDSPVTTVTKAIREVGLKESDRDAKRIARIRAKLDLLRTGELPELIGLDPEGRVRKLIEMVENGLRKNDPHYQERKLGNRFADCGNYSSAVVVAAELLGMGARMYQVYEINEQAGIIPRDSKQHAFAVVSPDHSNPGSQFMVDLTRVQFSNPDSLEESDPRSDLERDLDDNGFLEMTTDTFSGYLRSMLQTEPAHFDPTLLEQCDIARATPLLLNNDRSDIIGWFSKEG